MQIDENHRRSEIIEDRPVEEQFSFLSLSLFIYLSIYLCRARFSRSRHILVTLQSFKRLSVWYTSFYVLSSAFCTMQVVYVDLINYLHRAALSLSSIPWRDR